LAKKRSRSAEPATRYRRDQLAKRTFMPESMIATVVAPQAPALLPMKAPAAGHDESE
jgi:hypothetical protein